MVIPNNGKQYFLAVCFGIDGADAATLTLRLYVNDYTPVDGSNLGDFTAASFTGSDPISVAPGDWGSVTTVSDVAQADLDTPPTWTNTGGTTETAYGWYLEYPGGSIAVAAQRFDTPRVMSPGAVETLDPFRFKLKTFA